MMKRKIPFLKHVHYLLQAAIFYPAVAFFSLFPHGMAASLLAFIFGLIGPFIKKGQNILLCNLELVYPNWSHQQRTALAKQVWQHLGRISADFIHLRHIAQDLESYIQLSGSETVEKAKAQGKAIMFISGHFGNWEVTSFIGNLTPTRPNFIYRAVNNPYIDGWVKRNRCYFKANLLPKSNDSARQVVKFFRQGEDNGFLIDQKLNQGDKIDFFKHPCPTATTPINLALRYDYQFLMCHSLRIQKSFFAKPYFEYHIATLETLKGEEAKNTAEKIHHILENWIIKNPEQWFWLHDRWGQKSNDA